MVVAHHDALIMVFARAQSEFKQKVQNIARQNISFIVSMKSASPDRCSHRMYAMVLSSGVLIHR